MSDGNGATVDETIQVVLDTSTLRGTSITSAPFSALLELSQFDHLRIHIPEVAFQERRTQWREEYAKSLKELLDAASRLGQDRFLSFDDRSKFAKSGRDLGEISAADSVSVRVFDEFATRNRIHRVSPTKRHLEVCLARYFSGETPMKSVKSRADIPDALIYAAVEELSEITPNLYFVCDDARLRDAVSNLPTVRVFQKIEELLQDDGLSEMQAQLKEFKAWEVAKALITIGSVTRAVEKFVDRNVDRLLSDSAVFIDNGDPAMHEQVGHVTGVFEAGDVRISHLAFWGIGWISVDVAVEAPVYLDNWAINDAQKSLVLVEFSLSAHVKHPPAHSEADCELDEFSIEGEPSVWLLNSE